MAVNKVQYNGNVLIDITDTTAAASNVETGKYFYTNAGVRTSGTLTISTIYTGSTTPSASLGANGDIYIQV